MVRYAKRKLGRYYKRSSKRKYSRSYKRGVTTAYRALRVAKSLSRKVASELCKWQVTPNSFSNGIPNTQAAPYAYVNNKPLNTITSGTPWVMPLNWLYTAATSVAGSTVYINGIEYDTSDVSAPYPFNSVSVRNPLWYNTLDADSNNLYDIPESGVGLQYRLAYIYIRGIFNASASGQNNTDGAVRFVIVKDKQPQGGSATWFDSNQGNGISSRGVFTSNFIDAQLNPKTSGRFKIMYDKTLRFTTINGYKPFKYFKRLSTVVRNTRNAVTLTNQLTNSNGSAQSNDAPPPVLKNAYYLMIFSDGPTFSFSEESSTPNASFHLYSRIGYYNN